MAATLRRAKIERLKYSPIFSALQNEELEVIGEYSEYFSFKEKDIIFRAGSPGQALYIIEKGEVIIYKESNNGRSIDIARFTEGDCFGELDMLTGSARSAYARAEVESRLLVFPGESLCFKEILEKHPAISARILHKILVEIAGRIRKTNSLIKENSPLIQELKKQVYIDKLTGLYNKTFLEEKINEYLAKKSCGFGLLILKPDNFKLINDSYGHDAGDQALRVMAFELTRTVSEDAIVCRYMGNALSVVLDGAVREEAYQTALQIQRSLNSLDLRKVCQGNSFNLSISIGIIIFPEHTGSGEELITMTHELPLVGRQRGGNMILFPEDKET